MTDADERDWVSKAGRWVFLYLFAFAFFAWGLAAGRWYVFPGGFVARVEQDLRAFIAGHQEDQTTLREKILNDANIEPTRFLHTYPYEAFDAYLEVPLPGATARRDTARVLPAGDGRSRIVVGALDLEDAFWGAVMIGGDGRVQHVWRLSGELAELDNRPDVNKNLYGVEFFPDGSVAYNLQEANRGLIKRDVCSEVAWVIHGPFHHAATATEDFGSFWTIGGGQMDMFSDYVRLDAETGEVAEVIFNKDLFDNNPKAHILDLRLKEDTINIPHPNDVEPLPSAWADAFERSAAGHLLVTNRTLNLVYAFDPVKLTFDWWYFGAGDGPHDADWQPDGSVTVFSNNYHHYWTKPEGERFSDIVRIDLNDNTHEVIVDGSDYGIYSRINGQHQVTPHGTVLITSSTQGRVVEVDLESGDVVFEFINAYDAANGRTLRTSDAFVIPERFFDGVDFGACQG